MPKPRLHAELAFGPRLRVRDWRYRNGLRLLVLRDPSAPVVSYQTWLGVGSRHEEDGKTGLAHFFEHLMFNETSTTPQGELDKRFEEVGAESNAATWTDWTCYYENLPSRELDLAIELEADRLQNLVLKEPQIESEREVVMSERRDRIDDDVEGRAGELLWATALRNHPYRHPTLGWMRDIRRYTPDDCRAFYRTWYAPNNVTLAVAGKLDEKHLLDAVGDAYGAMKRSKLPSPVPHRSTRARKEKRKEVRLPTAGEKLHVAYPAPPFADPDWLVVQVIGQHLFSSSSSRAHRELVMEREIANHVWGYLPPFQLDSLYEIGVDLRPGELAEDALAILDAEIERLAEGIDDTALQRAKARLELSAFSSMETAGGKADLLGFYATLGLAPNAIFDRIDATRNVTTDRVREVSSRVFDPRRRTVLLVRPEAS